MVWRRFQFPSNGKVYPKAHRTFQTDPMSIVSIPFKREGVSKDGDDKQTGFGTDTVSIPFKREGVSKGGSVHRFGWVELFQFPSNGKVYPKLMEKYDSEGLKSFNSLQTGRCIQSFTPLWRVWRVGMCFNSLQTGRCIQRKPQPVRTTRVVSFNSLQTGRCIQSFTQQLQTVIEWTGFNSLQTGRCIQRSFPEEGKGGLYVHVSIPFKREGVSKATTVTRNGSVVAVSIPFKREGVSKVALLKGLPTLASVGGFNSLQTGRCIQRDPILSPVGPWLQKPKTKREVHTPIFMSKFTPKIPQTHVAIEPNTIFYQKRLGTQTPRAFLGNLRGIGIRLPNRVCCVCVDILSIP